MGNSIVNLLWSSSLEELIIQCIDLEQFNHFRRKHIEIERNINLKEAAELGYLQSYSE